MEIRFLGTGAADWWDNDLEHGAGSGQPWHISPERRRLTSTLFDGTLLIDGHRSALETLFDPNCVTVIFYTHSHGDHYDPTALERLRPVAAWAHESWAAEIRAPGVTVKPLKLFKTETAAGFTLTPLPSNHSTSRGYETTLHYLIEREGKRVLYATDGAWLLNSEMRALQGVELDGAVFDATIGDAHPGDYRIFEHNSLDMVRLMCATMRKTGMLKPDAPVFLTHMARTLHPDQQALEKENPTPFVVCRDGLEVTL